MKHNIKNFSIYEDIIKDNLYSRIPIVDLELCYNNDNTYYSGINMKLKNGNSFFITLQGFFEFLQDLSSKNKCSYLWNPSNFDINKIDVEDINDLPKSHIVPLSKITEDELKYITIVFRS